MSSLALLVTRSCLASSGIITAAMEERERLKAERAAAHKEETIRELRKALGALEARHRARQAALREREVRRVAPGAAPVPPDEVPDHVLEGVQLELHLLSNG